MSDQSSPGWAIPGDGIKSDLTPLLDYARNQYASHTDWYLRHKESGINTLGAVLTAEFALLGVYFSGGLHRSVTLIALLSLAVLAVPLARLALLNCKKSFQASLEHALLVTKVVWAMGLAGKVYVPPHTPNDRPARADEHIYVDRYLRDALRARTTSQFVTENLDKRDSTYHATRTILVLMASAAVVAGLIGATAAWLFNGKAG